MKELLPYVGLLAFLLSMVSLVYQFRKDAQSDLKGKFKEVSEKVETALTRLTVIETKSEIYFRGMSVSAATALHSPHTPELDRLLEKFQRDEIRNERELYRLKELLQEIADSDPEPSRQKLARDALLLIHVRFEIGGDLIDRLRKQNQSVDHALRSFSARIKP